MSLCFSLEALRPVTTFEINITSNLTPMAERAGLYSVLWRPVAGMTASDALPELRAGLATLLADPNGMREFNPPNGWGSCDTFVDAVRKIVAACEESPDAVLWAHL